METGELESLLQGATETPSFEVKGCMAWDDKALARDIMAMSNIRDGGNLVIGIEDGTFARQGVDEATRATYNVDIMRDQMAKVGRPERELLRKLPYGQ